MNPAFKEITVYLGSYVAVTVDKVLLGLESDLPDNSQNFVTNWLGREVKVDDFESE